MARASGGEEGGARAVAKGAGGSGGGGGARLLAAAQRPRHPRAVLGRRHLREAGGDAIELLCNRELQLEQLAAALLPRLLPLLLLQPRLQAQPLLALLPQLLLRLAALLGHRRHRRLLLLHLLLERRQLLLQASQLCLLPERRLVHLVHLVHFARLARRIRVVCRIHRRQCLIHERLIHRSLCGARQRDPCSAWRGRRRSGSCGRC